jgi:hypothetical protein
MVWPCFHAGTTSPAGTLRLSQAANAAARSKGTYLAAHYARIKGRRGHKRAIVR